MKLPLASFLPSGQTTLLVLGGIAVAALGTWGVRAYLKSRPSEAEIERRRRSALHSRGKMGDANLLEFHDHVVLYSYAVGGVEYTASQDLSDLATRLPSDQWTTFGPVSIKYDPRNPANSIVVSEEWSGLRVQRIG